MKFLIRIFKTSIRMFASMSRNLALVLNVRVEISYWPQRRVFCFIKDTKIGAETSFKFEWYLFVQRMKPCVFEKGRFNMVMTR